MNSLITILAIILISFNQAVRPDNKYTVINPTNSKSSTNYKCMGKLYIQTIPEYCFLDQKNTNAFNQEFLIDTLFKGFKISKIYSDWSEEHDGNFYFEFYINSQKVNDYHMGEPSKNRFRFVERGNNKWALIFAESNFSTSRFFDQATANSLNNYSRESYKKNTKLFEIKKNGLTIDIGMSKMKFSESLKKDLNKTCDTLEVSGDSNKSWYVFDNDTLKKIIHKPYID